MIKIEKTYHFYAAHRNKEAGEKCGRIHGHTYDIKVILCFDKVQSNGVTILFQDIDRLIEPIIKEYDHYLLLHDKDSLVDVLNFANEQFKTVPFETSAENLGRWLGLRIKRETKLPIIELHLAETKSSNVITTFNYHD